MQLFENNTHDSRPQPGRPNFSRSQLRLPDNNNPATKTQANKPVETPPFLWERALRRRLGKRTDCQNQKVAEWPWFACFQSLSVGHAAERRTNQHFELLTGSLLMVGR
jgi:hypothetical protein